MNVLEQIAALRAERLANPPAPVTTQSADLSAFSLADFKNFTVEKSELEGKIETSPRMTVIRLIQECGYNEEFVFFVLQDTGELYTNAMRACISRIRRKLQEERRNVEQWRLVTVRIARDGPFDKVIMKRTPPGQQMRTSQLYEQLERLLEGGK